MPLEIMIVLLSIAGQHSSYSKAYNRDHSRWVFGGSEVNPTISFALSKNTCFPYRRHAIPPEHVSPAASWHSRGGDCMENLVGLKMRRKPCSKMFSDMPNRQLSHSRLSERDIPLPVQSGPFEAGPVMGTKSQAQPIQVGGATADRYGLRIRSVTAPSPSVNPS